jgi:hypothetical protein
MGEPRGDHRVGTEASYLDVDRASPPPSKQAVVCKGSVLWGKAGPAR